MTPAGTFLVAYMEGSVVEYDGDGKEIWRVPAAHAWAAVRLKSGNTLISGDQEGYVREVDPAGNTVWGITQNELPGFTLTDVQEVSRLENGNTTISNWISGSQKPEDWAKTFQFIEVSPDKKVVWALSSWKAPDLGPATSIQLLDQPGKPEEGSLQR